MKHVQIVANPSAGSYDSKQVGRLAQAFEVAGAKVASTPAGPGLPLQINVETDVVCVVGGDGSIRHAAQALLSQDRNIALAAWPGGTVNLFQREHLRPKDEQGFAAEVLAAAPAQHFVVSANDTVFLGCASIGPDAEAVARLSDKLKQRIGRAAYGAALLGVIGRWSRPKLQIEVNGQTHECEAAYIAMGRYFAGPWSFAPQADRRENTLHLVLLKRCRRRDFAKFVFQVLLKRDLGQNSNLIRADSQNCVVTSAQACAVQIDGDIGPQLPLTLKCLDRPINVV